MFWRTKKDDAPVLTNETYTRWLRAQRPPWAWFLRISELEQEQLALLGDDYMRDLAVAVGYAVADPKTAEAGAAAVGGDTAGEEVLAKQVANSLLARLLKGGLAPTVAPSAPQEYDVLATHAGSGSRRKQAAEAADSVRRSMASLFGQQPDRGTP